MNRSVERTWCPHIRLWAANITDFIPEEQTLFTVVASVESDKPNSIKMHSNQLINSLWQISQVRAQIYAQYRFLPKRDDASNIFNPFTVCMLLTTATWNFAIFAFF